MSIYVSFRVVNTAKKVLQYLSTANCF